MRSQTSSKRFLYEAVTWLRALPNFSSEVRDDDELDPDHRGFARIRGHLARASHANISAYVALWGLFAGAVLSMFGMPAIGRGTNAIINEVGYVVLALGVAAWVEYGVVSRRSRSPLLVEIRGAAAPVTEDVVERLHSDAAGGTAWIISEAPAAPEVLAKVTQLGVHWVALQHLEPVAKQEPVRAA